MCAAVSTDGDALFKIDELSLTISTESNISNYSLTSTSFKCAPDFPSCRQPNMRSIDDILALGRYYNQTWRPGEVACSIIGSYIADSPILPIMYEQEEKVNYTFVMKKTTNIGYVSQLYTGKQIGSLMSSKSTPFEQVTQVLHEELEVSDVDNMPPIFVNKFNETTELIIIKSDLNSCRQVGTVVDINAIDGDRFLDEEIQTKVEFHSVMDKNGDVFEYFKNTIYCTTKTEPDPYIIEYRAIQANNPDIRTNSMHVVFNLRDLKAESKD